MTLADRIRGALKGRALSFDSLRHELGVSAQELDAALQPLRAARRVLPEGGRLVLAEPPATGSPAEPVPVAPAPSGHRAAAREPPEPAAPEPQPTPPAEEPARHTGDADMPKTKTCETCSESKPLEAFDYALRAKDGRTKDCKACRGTAPKKRAPKAVQTPAPEGAATSIAAVAAKHARKPPTKTDAPAAGLAIPARRAFTATRDRAGAVVLAAGEGRGAERLTLSPDEMRAVAAWWREQEASAV